MVVEADGLPHRARWAPTFETFWKDRPAMESGGLSRTTTITAAKCLRGWIKCLMWLLLLADPAPANPGVSDSGMLLPIKITSSHHRVILASSSGINMAAQQTAVYIHRHASHGSSSTTVSLVESPHGAK